ncbi:hypothetical protein CO670_28985 [Rhizobium sp. J15]|uniref:hypothetical protein n=1 Tax=Rhizobium sp. J15 TaxID=2035450 RepID=UPI000BE7F1DB|nr:hypothetical protein [Rhizobium sp. J15]PDT12147.1 hypothetical protein CO670_28985 [Rhizobium sp. J15]
MRGQVSLFTDNTAFKASVSGGHGKGYLSLDMEADGVMVVIFAPAGRRRGLERIAAVMNEEFGRPPAEGDGEDEALEAELAAGIEAIGF